MKILITGGAGSLGMNLLNYFSKKNFNILILDNLTTGNKNVTQFESNNITFKKIDITNYKKLLKEFDFFKPQELIHLAASYDDPDNWQRDIKTNIEGINNLINLSKLYNVERIINIQTILCYKQEFGQIDENGEIKPISSYSISKTAAESYLHLSGLNFISFRLSSVFGPWSFSGPIPIFYKKISNVEDCLVSDTYRDFIYVDDFINLFDKTLKNKKLNGIFNVSNGEPISIKEIFNYMIEAINPIQKVKFKEIKNSNDDVKKIFLDSSKIRKALNWKPQSKFIDSLKKTILWYDKNGVGKSFTHLKKK